MSSHPKQSFRISPSSVMAIAIAGLVVALSIQLGWVSKAIHMAKETFHHHDAAGIAAADVLSDTPVPPAVPSAPVPPTPLDQEVFNVVERAPSMIGGAEGLIRRIHYPAAARKAGTEGTVYLTFVVEKDGLPSQVEVVRGIGDGCDEEAVRALKETTFVPGEQRGIPVRVKMALPVAFKLQ